MGKLRKCIVVCYFGQFPDYMQLWLDSCARNPSWDWLLITDVNCKQCGYIIPKNMKIIFNTFIEFRKYVKSRFDFLISLEESYKWCDFKPAIGYIFKDYLVNYDYWGFCDLDMIFGDLEMFYPDSLIEKYEKFLVLGHLQLYKNTKKINTLFMEKIVGKAFYRSIFSSKYNYAFDETGKISVYQIARKYGIDQYENLTGICDIFPYSGKLAQIKYENIKQTGLYPISFVLVNKYGVYAVADRKKNPCVYVHFQKREFDLKMNVTNVKKYYISNNIITDDKNMLTRPINQIVQKMPSNKDIWLKRFMRLKDLILLK